MNAPPPSAQVEFNPWQRSCVPYYQYSAEDMHYFLHRAQRRPKFEDHLRNAYLDIDTKKAAIKAAPFVVALVSYSGEKELYQGCGTIIEVHEDNKVIVITSANLIRRPSKEKMVENTLADDLKVFVHASDEIAYEGEILGFDFHYNLLVIKFKSDTLLPAARLRELDDGQSLTSHSFTLRPHSVKPGAGDSVIAVGRYFIKPFDIMAAPGCISLDRCEFDCKELCLVTCKITRCGDGCSLINLSGEVIGIMFYDISSVMPFLPINIVRKWWEHYKSYGEYRHPYMGFEATNLHAARLAPIDRVIKRFPSISKGVILEKVIPGSSAESAGLQPNDIIVQCNGKTVESFLELWGVMWDKVGGGVELVVARADCSSFLSLNMMVVEATPDELNSWPRREYL